MKVAITTASTGDPITLDQAKEFLRVDTEDDDGLILAQITGATNYAQDVQGRKYMTQTWTYYLDEWPDKDYINLPFPPLQSITSLKYTDSADAVTTVSTSSYNVDSVSEPGRLVLAYGETWPLVTLAPLNPIAIVFTCGYGGADDVPEETKNAIKLILDELYETREVNVTGQINRIDLIDRLLMTNRTFNY